MATLQHFLSEHLWGIILYFTTLALLILPGIMQRDLDRSFRSKQRERGDEAQQASHDPHP